MITPDQIEQAAIDLLADKLVWHIATLERSLGLPPRTIQFPKTIDVLPDATQALEVNLLPAVLLAIGGGANPLDSAEGYAGPSASIPWRMEFQIAALGGGVNPQVDAMKRVRWLALVTLECMWRRFTRLEDLPIELLTISEVPEFEVIVDAPVALGRAAFTLDILSETFTTDGQLPNEDGDPYDQPTVYPGLVAQPADMTRVDLEEPV